MTTGSVRTRDAVGPGAGPGAGLGGTDGANAVPAANLLVIMSDEHGPMFSSAYGHPIVRTPHLAGAAARGVTFDARTALRRSACRRGRPS